MIISNDSIACDHTTSLVYRIGHIYDAVELQSNRAPVPQSVVYETPSVGSSKDVKKMQGDPAYQTTN